MRTILVVEDSDEDFAVLTWAFNQADIKHPIRRSKTAQDALALLSSHQRLESPPFVCLVVLDLNLPDAEGAVVLQQMRRIHDCATLPIVVYTTAGRHQTIKECYAAGASSYAIKALGLDAAEKFAKALRAWWLETACTIPA